MRFMTDKAKKVKAYSSVFCVSLFLLVTGCSSQQTKPSNGAGALTKQDELVAPGAIAKPTTKAPASFDARVGSAVTSPLGDLNIVRTEIPAILIEAKKAPYGLPKAIDCNWLAGEIQMLDQVLGPDVDMVRLDAEGNIIERGGEQLENAAVGALQSFAEGFVPFRSWVRRLTGADRHAKDVAAAGIAGIVRRAFLKGVASTKACELPVQIVMPADADKAKQGESK
jgi:hypothetical protein